jgi:hypothetical protein
MRPVVLTLLLCAGCGGSEPPRAPINDDHGSTSVPVADPGAIADLDEGERRIEVSAGDCGGACEGLATMTHARIKLCSPRTSACDDAERREGDARRKVASFCDKCPSL